jgi:hypothetical protein
MPLIIEYEINDNKALSKETIKSCHDSFKAFQSLFIETTKIAFGNNLFIILLAWVLTRFYKRVITSHSIKYEFYLIPDPRHKKGK